MDTKDLMTKKSRVREAMDWMSGPPTATAEESDSRTALLEKRLRQVDRKVGMLEVQKQNLSETCASQDAYIAQLSRDLEALREGKSQADRELEQLGGRLADSAGLSETVTGLRQELEEARARIGLLEETARTQQMETDRHTDELEALLREKDTRLEQLGREHELAAGHLQEAQARIEQFEQAAQTHQTEADRRRSDLEAVLRERDARIEQLIQQCEQFTGQMQEAEQTRQQMERAHHELQSQLAETAGQLDVLRVQKEVSDQELAELRGLHAAAAGQQNALARLQEELERSRDSQRQLEQMLRQGQGEYDQERTMLREKLEEKERLFQKIAEQRDQVSLELEDMQAAHSRVKKEYTELHRRMSAAAEELEALRSQSGQTAQEMERLRAERETAVRQREQIERMERELEQAREKIRMQEEVLSSTQDRQAADLAAVRQQLHEAEQTIHHLQGQKDLAAERQKNIDRLGGELEESRVRIRQLEETLRSRQEEFDRQRVSLETDRQENQTECRTLSARLAELEQIRLRLEGENQTLQDRMKEQAVSSEKAVQEAEESRSYVAALQQEGLRREQEVETARRALREAEQKLEAQDRTGRRAEQQVAQLQGELDDLRTCFQQVLEEKVALRKQLTALEEYETRYLAVEESSHRLAAELEDVRFRLEEKCRQLERAAAVEQDNRQRQEQLQDKLEQKNDLLEQLQQQEEHLLRQIETHGQTIERQRHEHQQLCKEMELQRQDLEKQCRRREEAIESLQTRLAEVSNQASEFERLSRQAHEENNHLRESLSRTEERLAETESRLARQAEENESMQKQIAQLEISAGQLAETRGQLQKAQRYIESMEQTLAQQSEDLAAAQQQLSRHVEFARELQLLSRKSEGIWQVPQIRPAEPAKPSRPTPKSPAGPAEPANQLDDETVIISKTAPAAAGDSDCRTAALRNQLLEQTENLRRAHETIRLLREQKNGPGQTEAKPTAGKSEEPEVSWITKPASDRQTRDAVRQFLEEQEMRGFQNLSAPLKPAPEAAPAPFAAGTAAPQTPAPAEPQTDEKTKSLFRKFGLLGGWSANK